MNATNAALPAVRQAQRNWSDFYISVIGGAGDLFIAKSRQRTFVGDNQLLAVAVNSAAITVLWTPNLLGLSF